MMITVNLRPGLKRKRPGAGGRELVGRLRELGTKIKDPLLLGSVAACLIVAIWLSWSFISTNSRYNALEPQLEQARDEERRFANLLKQKQRAEAIRDSLLSQIATIRGVDGDRYVWPHVLDEVSKALPAYTWLTSITVLSQPAAVSDSADTTQHPMLFKMEGRTMDLQAYTRFLRQLEASPWLLDVTPLSAQTIVEKDRPVTQFTVQASFKKADSAYIRTVPLSQSVR
jgi:type IV pilus assembly protein PilN